MASSSESSIVSADLYFCCAGFARDAVVFFGAVPAVDAAFGGRPICPFGFFTGAFFPLIIFEMALPPFVAAFLAVDGFSSTNFLSTTGNILGDCTLSSAFTDRTLDGFGVGASLAFSRSSLSCSSALSRSSGESNILYSIACLSTRIRAKASRAFWIALIRCFSFTYGNSQTFNSLKHSSCKAHLPPDVFLPIFAKVRVIYSSGARVFVAKLCSEAGPTARMCNAGIRMASRSAWGIGSNVPGIGERVPLSRGVPGPDRGVLPGLCPFGFTRPWPKRLVLFSL